VSGAAVLWGVQRPGPLHTPGIRRMWHFYLTCMAGVFRAEDLRLCQIVYGKGPIGDVRSRL
jgi:hypothetical protein